MPRRHATSAWSAKAVRSNDALGAFTVGYRQKGLVAPGPQTLHEKRLPLTSSSATGSTAPAEQFRAF